MKIIVSIIFASLLATSAVCMGEINPFTGDAIKQTDNKTVNPPKNVTTPPSTSSMPMLPAPPISSFMPQSNIMNPTNPQQKDIKHEKKEYKPSERFIIDGIVNDNIIIKDLEN